MSIGLPVNIGYKFQTNGNIAISPYAGLTPKVNIISQEYRDRDVSRKTINFFDDDRGGQRFQIGCQIEVGMDINKFHVGIGYYSDILPILKLEESGSYEEFEYTLKNSSIRLTVGVNF